MATISDIIQRYAEEAGKPNARMLHNSNANVFVGGRYYSSRNDTRTIYSYGTHFPMAVLMPKDGNPRGWWLVNGDTYSVSTSRHQSELRAALSKTGLPVMIVPFTAIRAAGVERDSITPVEIMPDRYTWEKSQTSQEPSDYDLNYSAMTRNWRQVSDGVWEREVQVHHLGQSVFTADIVKSTPVRDAKTGYISHYDDSRERRFYLSAFDENEPGFGLYFLAELPAHEQPATVDEAFEALKPQEVKDAEAEGREILRQGDVFAISTAFRTKDLPGPSKRSEYVLDVNHQVTEVRVSEGENGTLFTYGRGIMRHRPRQMWRRPEHRMVKLGNQKDWYRFVKNTVPEGRSWSIQGNVD